MTYWALLGLVVALAAGSFTLGFVRRPPQPHEAGYLFWSFVRGKVQGGFVFLVVVLVPLTVFALWRAEGVTAEVAEFITPYPYISETVWVPDVDGDPGSEAFLVETGDSPALVVDFYTDPANREGWDLVAANEAMVHLSRPGETLFIMVSAGRGGSSVAFVRSSG